jgi:hypothetical protein
MTLILTILLFITSYLFTIFIMTPFGGCAGCIPDGRGGVNCSNQCDYPHPVIFGIGAYLISYLITIIYRNKANFGPSNRTQKSST